MKQVRLRFAPSPTGYLHIGGLRTALYNYLFAKHSGGKFILRIEDTDRSRYVEGAIEDLIESLNWAGIKYDEGVFIEDGKVVERGDYGPYIQSKRLDIYQKYVDLLIEQGDAYYCFCSKDRLDEVREEQKVKGLIPKYDGFCRSLSLDEARERISEGEEYVVRLKLPHNRDIKFHDVVRGDITINTEDIDDQVLLKSDGYPTYHMAVVIDDHLMGITHIVRGEEWLSSVPKHVYLYEVLGWDIPVFVHLPTVLNKDRKKLSKRHGDVAVEDFMSKGYLPEGLINYLALVGWSPENNQEIFSMEELIKAFSFERVAKTGGIFDINKLNWVNGHHIRNYDLDELTRLAIPYLKEAGYIDDRDIKEKYNWIKTMVETVREGISYISEITEKVDIFFNNKIEPEDENALSMLKGQQVPAILDAFKEELKEIEEVDEEFTKGIMKRIQRATGVKGKDLFMPTRVALTGNSHGPELTSIMYILGKQNILARIEYIEENFLKG
ncbi:MAG TPA: glutamate--tRNA ligase [Tepidimicrobium sp.]|nr:glutamate--tRNA ligase [Tepidimicrobium sp.]